MKRSAGLKPECNSDWPHGLEAEPKCKDEEQLRGCRCRSGCGIVKRSAKVKRVPNERKHENSRMINDNNYILFELFDQAITGIYFYVFKIIFLFVH